MVFSDCLRQVPGEQWVPGSIATVALFMINSVRRCVPCHFLSISRSTLKTLTLLDAGERWLVAEGYFLQLCDARCGVFRVLLHSSQRTLRRACRIQPPALLDQLRCVGRARMELPARHWSSTRKALHLLSSCAVSWSFAPSVARHVTDVGGIHAAIACGCTTRSTTARTVAFGTVPNPHPHICINTRVQLRSSQTDRRPTVVGGVGRRRFWLFLAYVVSFGALVGAVWNLVANYGATNTFRSPTLP